MTAESFDPFAPGALMRAFADAERGCRADVLHAALQPMGKGLRGIDAVVDLMSVDEGAFLAGLRRCVASDPGNLTAARALAWFYVRNAFFAEASRVYEAAETHWGEYGELFLEHIRTLVVDGRPAEAASILASSQRFLKSPGRESYALQSGALQSGALQTGALQTGAVQDGLAESLLTQGACALRDSLSAAAPGSRGVRAAEEAAFWQAASQLLRARTVALVGNSATVRGRGLGQDIDGHDLVIRCNFPETDGYEGDVGRRTDLVFFNESLRPRVARIRREQARYGATLAIGLHPEPQFGLPGDEAWASGDGVGTIFPSIRKFISAISYSRSTTGLMAINLLLFVFAKRVTLFGFDFFSDLKTPHYFGNQAGAYLGHELQYEQWFVRSFLQRLMPQMIDFRT